MTADPTPGDRSPRGRHRWARLLWVGPAVVVVAVGVVEPPDVTLVTALAAAYVMVLSLAFLRRRRRSTYEDDRGLAFDLDELAVVALALVADPVIVGVVYGTMALTTPATRWYRSAYTVTMRALVGVGAALLGQLLVPTSPDTDVVRYAMLLLAATVVHLVLTIGSTLGVVFAIRVETGGVLPGWYQVSSADAALAAMAIPLGAVGADLLGRSPLAALLLGVAVAGAALALTRLLVAEMAVRDEEYRRQSVLARSAELADAERRALVREVHDGPLQQLILARMLLETATTPTNAEPDLVPDRALEDVDAALGRSITELRQALSGSSSSLVIHGLGSAIESFAAATVVPEVTKLRVVSSLPSEFGTSGAAGEQVGEVVLACVRELVTNALKHARASEIRVELTLGDDDVIADVIDDGVGFDPDEVLPRRQREGHLGIPLVRERLDRVGGRLELDVGPGRGARARCRVPLSS